eukprot:SAG31_NODE_1105_length_9882_cov_5.270571_5_plen_50_part_00
MKSCVDTVCERILDLCARIHNNLSNGGHKLLQTMRLFRTDLETQSRGKS